MSDESEQGEPLTQLQERLSYLPGTLRSQVDKFPEPLQETAVDLLRSGNGTAFSRNVDARGAINPQADAILIELAKDPNAAGLLTALHDQIDSQSVPGDYRLLDTKRFKEGESKFAYAALLSVLPPEMLPVDIKSQLGEVTKLPHYKATVTQPHGYIATYDRYEEYALKQLKTWEQIKELEEKKRSGQLETLGAEEKLKQLEKLEQLKKDAPVLVDGSFVIMREPAQSQGNSLIGITVRSLEVGENGGKGTGIIPRGMFVDVVSPGLVDAYNAAVDGGKQVLNTSANEPVRLGLARPVLPVPSYAASLSGDMVMQAIDRNVESLLQSSSK